MLMPDIFKENLFDDFFDEFARPARNVVRYNTPVTNIMKTDIREHDMGFELDIDLPGYRKEDGGMDCRKDQGSACASA